jgi:methionine biosynthesis protein MetW
VRLDYSIVANWVKPETQVLDLGCGDGSLLLQLQNELNVHAYGLEINEEHILQCVNSGINVVEQDIEKGLSNFEDKRFDTVIMSQAIQTLQHPDKALAEMLRIGRECIITFPNFGHWKARLHLAFNGRMPVSDLLPYEWYDTPNIHFCTFKDFDIMCQQMNASIINREVIATRSLGKTFQGLHPNLFGETALYRVRGNA